MAPITDIRMARSLRQLTKKQQELVLGELPAIKQLTRTLGAKFPRVGRDDVEQSVWVGYCEAALEANPAMPQAAFAAYARIRVHGRMIDLCLRDWRQSPMYLAELAFGKSFAELVVADDAEDPWISDEAIIDPIRAASSESIFRAFLGSTFEAWRYLGEQGLVDHMTRLTAFRELKKTFPSLSEPEWKLYELYYVDCLTWAQVGAAFGIQDKAAQQRAKGIRDKLRRELLSRGVRQAPPEET